MHKESTRFVRFGQLAALVMTACCMVEARAGGTEVYVGVEPSSVAVADLNGDGMPDIVTANMDGNITVVLNTTLAGNTNLSFAAPQDFTAGDSPVAVVAADLNGDGLPDLIVANNGDSTVTVLINTTTPGSSTVTFAAPQQFATGSGPYALAVADINGDGLPDVIVANENDNTVSILINSTPVDSPTASFVPQQTFATGGMPFSVAAADLNGDGVVDLAVANYGDNTVSVLLNTTVVGSTTASFTAQQAFAAGNIPMAVNTVDLNGDGIPDLVVVNDGDNTVDALLNTTVAGSTTASFAAEQIFNAGSYSAAVAGADLNGDGVQDLVVADDGSGQVEAFLNTTITGSSTVSLNEQDFPTGGWATAMVLADMNGDGVPDVVVASTGDNSVTVLLNATMPGSTTLNLQ